MKKKFLSIVLAIVMALGTFSALVGCDEENKLPDQSQNQEQSQGNNQGNQGSQNKPEDNKEESGGNQDAPTKPEDGKEESQTKPEDGKEEGGQDKPEDGKEEGGKEEEPEDKGPTYNVGDKIEDEKTLNALILSLHPAMKSLEGRLVKEGISTNSDYISSSKTEYKVLADFESNGLDMTIFDDSIRDYLKEDKDNELVKGSSIHVRGDIQYERAWQVEPQTINKDATLEELKEKYKEQYADCTTIKTKDGRINYSRVNFILTVPFFSTAVKLLGNIAVYSENDFYKMETGYSLSVDLLGEEGILSKVFADVDAVLDSIDIENITLSVLMEHKQASKILQTLLNEITAKELYNIIDFIMDIDNDENPLPAAKDGQTAFDYLKALLIDKEFYKTVSGGEDGMLGSFTLKELLTGSNDVTKEEFKEYWAETKEELREEIFDFAHSLGIPNEADYDAPEQKTLLNFLFGEDKKLDKIEFSFTTDVSSESGEKKGSFKIELIPQEKSAELEDLSKLKIRRVKDCNFSESFYFYEEDAYTISFVVADGKVTFKVESELFPELNFERTEDATVFFNIDYRGTISAESLAKYLEGKGETVEIRDGQVYIISEDGEKPVDLLHVNFGSYAPGFYLFGGDDDKYQFCRRLESEIEYEIVSEN